MMRICCQTCRPDGGWGLANQFIPHHKVVERLRDDHVTVELVAQTKRRFPSLALCSFDKGFHSKVKQEAVDEQLHVLHGAASANSAASPRRLRMHLDLCAHAAHTQR